jgi:tetratricopeptide (TPR) repeat protein
VRRGTLAVLVIALLGCGGKSSAPPSQPAADPLKTAPTTELFERGRELADAGDYVRAEQYLTAAMHRGHPSKDVLPVLLQACVRGRRYQSALGHAQRELRRNPEDWRLRYVVATLHEALGERTKAQVELKRVLDGEPRFANAHYSLGVLLSATDRRAASTHLHRYLEIEPKGNHAADARARLNALSIPEASEGGDADVSEQPRDASEDSSGGGQQ